MAVVFVYGSLLNPGSLLRTVPNVDLDACQPARLPGWLRCFDLAFPNDGSQPDKAFLDAQGDRPPFVLLANLRRGTTGSAVNGLLVEVSGAGLERLRRRERRYRLRRIPGTPQRYDGTGPVLGTVLTARGRAEFQGPEAVAAGVVPRSYVDDILAGAEHWSARTRGFAADFYDSTELPQPERIVDLQRVDLG
jgi:hypothetical protein